MTQPRENRLYRVSHAESEADPDPSLAFLGPPKARFTMTLVRQNPSDPAEEIIVSVNRGDKRCWVLFEAFKHETPIYIEPTDVIVPA